MTPTRAVVAIWALVAAVIVQVSVLPHLAWHGVVPDVVLVVVVAVGLRHGSELAMGLGLAGGLLLDLLPPADHVAGRWALALCLAGYLSGVLADPLDRMVRGRDLRAWVMPLATLGACSFVGTSCFGLTGLVLRDPLVGIPEVLTVVGIAMGMDLVVGALLLPALLRLEDRVELERLPV